jgi:Protein of unknown function (DUF1579)
MSSTISSKLNVLAGEWTGQETIAASQWGAGGKAISRISSRLDLTGNILIFDYQAERDGRPWLKAHAVYSFDGGDSYRLFWFDSLGFVPAEPAPGQWDGKSLVFVRSSPRGRTRHTYTFLTEASHAMLLESSFDGGVTWVQVMEGIYTRSK